MKAFTAPLLELAEFDTIQKTKYREPGMIQIAGSTGSQKGHLAYALARMALHGDVCEAMNQFNRKG